MFIGSMFIFIDEQRLPSLSQDVPILIGFISLFFWTLIQLTWGYEVDEKGVSCHYSINGKILIIQTFIKWEDVKKIVMGGIGRVHVYPKLQAGFKPKDFIMINQNTVKYKELVQKIVDKATNAEVENTVKVWLKSNK